MPPDNENLKSKALAAANRLCVIRSEMADQGEQVQGEYLSEELERILKDLAPEEQQVFLEELKKRFPLPEDMKFAASPSTLPVKENIAEKQQQLNDPDFLSDRLLKVLSSLTTEERETVLNRFHPSTVSQDKSQGIEMNIQPMERLQRLLALNKEHVPPDPVNMAILLVLLVEFIVKMEPLVWNTWLKLSSRGGIRPSGKMTDKMRKYICQDGEDSEKDIEGELKILQQLIAAMVSATKIASDEFAMQYINTYSPSAIETIVDSGGGSIMKAKKVRYWEHYEKLGKSLTRESVETQIRKAIVDHVSKIMNVGRHS